MRFLEINHTVSTLTYRLVQGVKLFSMLTIGPMLKAWHIVHKKSKHSKMTC